MDSMIVTTLLAVTRYISIMRPFYTIRRYYVFLYHFLEISWIFAACLYENRPKVRILNMFILYELEICFQGLNFWFIISSHYPHYAIIHNYNIQQETLYWVPVAQGTSSFRAQANSSDLYGEGFNMKWAYFVIPIILHCIVIITVSTLTIIALVKSSMAEVSSQSAQQCIKSSKKILFLNLGVIIQAISFQSGILTVTNFDEYHLTVNAVVLPIWLSSYNPIVLLVGENKDIILQRIRQMLFNSN